MHTSNKSSDKALKKGASKKFEKLLLAASMLCILSFILCGCSSNDSEETAMCSEQIVEWLEYKVTDTHELTFVVLTGTDTCYGLRTVVDETDEAIEVAIVEGVLPDAPTHCTMVARYEKLKITTTAPAEELKVRSLDPAKVDLNT